MTEELEISERRILQRIIGPIKDGGQQDAAARNYSRILTKLQELAKEYLHF